MNNQSNISSVTSILKSSTFHPIYHTLLLVLAILIAVENALVLVLYFKNTFLYVDATNRLSANLAFSDMFTGILVIPLLVASASLAGRNFTALYFISNVTSDFGTIYSVISICLIAYNRYMLVCRPYSETTMDPRFPNKKNLALALFVSLFVSGLPLIWNYSLLMDKNESQKSFQRVGDMAHSLTMMFLFFFVPSCLVLASLLLMFKDIRQSTREETRDSIHSRVNHKVEIATVVRFSYVYVAFMLCWLPLMVIRTLDDFNVRFKLNAHVIEVIFVLRCSTSFINPIVYTWGNRDYHRALSKCQCYRMLKQFICGSSNDDSNENNITAHNQDQICFSPV
eukprot:gene3166-3635_t